jgi:hypothetical protein
MSQDDFSGLTGDVRQFDKVMVHSVLGVMCHD